MQHIPVRKGINISTMPIASCDFEELLPENGGYKSTKSYGMPALANAHPHIPNHPSIENILAVIGDSKIGVRIFSAVLL